MTAQLAFDQFHQAVYSFAYRLTQREDIAEDITQECFLALIRAPHRFDPGRGSMKVYLFAIARNLALKHYRDERPADPLEESPYVAGKDVAGKDPSETLAISSAIAAAVAQLPDLQQEALILFEYEGMTLEEIAQVVSADVGTVKSRLHRARERLRRLLVGYRKTGDTHASR